jgi:14-3-3 protein epsilon
MKICNNILFALVLILCSNLIYCSRKLKTSQHTDNHAYLAMLAEQCGRLDDMMEFLDIIIQDQTKFEINDEERDLIISSYKKNISQRKVSLNTIQAYQLREMKKEYSPYLSYIREYKKRVESEMGQLCKKINGNIDNLILPKIHDGESKIMILLLKAYSYRQIVQISEGNSKLLFLDYVSNTYHEAERLAEKLNPSNPKRLQLALDLSIFTYEVLNNYGQAIDIVRKAVNNARKELPSDGVYDEQYKEAFSILNLLEENLYLWNSEEEYY